MNFLAASHVSHFAKSLYLTVLTRGNCSLHSVQNVEKLHGSESDTELIP
jgi:L-asparaginase/Glu-tRNA(Gln) amidotransferase subunit D